MIPKKPKSPITQHLKATAKRDIWLHATACGSLWAALEIVLGSFLHNLRLPFAGTVLAAMTVMLLVAFDRRFAKPGLAWRAGLVCALMKSISPSAVIFGPMIGIMTEALIVDLALRLPGPRSAVAALGGALALFSALVHKIITLLIIYGSDLAALYHNLTRFATRETGISALGGRQILAFLAIVYLVVGTLAALTGRIIGGLSENPQPVTVPKVENAADTVSPLAASILRPPRKPAVQILIVLAHLGSVVFCLFLLKKSLYAWAISIELSYIILSSRLYPTVARRILRPKIWLQFIIITLLAGLFLAGFQGHENATAQGLQAGLDMCLRALVLVTGFAALGSELRNPAVALVVRNPHLKHLHTALETAFSLLPRITSVLDTPLTILRHPIRALANWISTVDPLICELRNSAAEKTACWLVTGEVGEGKTTAVEHHIRQIQAAGFTVGGILTRNVKRHDNAAAIYDLVAYRSGEIRSLTAAPDETDIIETGIHHHRFSRAAFAWANRQIQADIEASDIIVIDEIGTLELRGDGFAPALHACLAAHVPCLFAVNTTRLEKLMPLLDDASCHIL